MSVDKEGPWHLRATMLPHGAEPVDLWIVDGRITFTSPPASREVAPAGGYMSAGLVDAHTHVHFVGDPASTRGGRELIDDNRRQHLLAGTLLLRDLGATSDAVLNLPTDDGLPPVQAAGMCLLVEDRFPFKVTAARELASHASGQARAGAQWVKIFADWPGWPGNQQEPPFADDPMSYPPATLVEAVEAAHAAGARVAVHAFGRDGAAAAIAAGVDSIEHGWSLDEDLLAEMVRKRIAWTPMMSLAVPMLRSADPPQAAWIRSTTARLRTLIPYAHGIGVVILAGTDWFPYLTVRQEIASLREYGLDAVAALAAASSAARAFLGVPDLVEGAPADLVLYGADPRVSPDALAHPAAIFLRGRRVNPSAI